MCIAQFLTHWTEIEVLQQKTRRITHTYEYPVPQKKDDSRIYCLIDIQTIIKL